MDQLLTHYRHALQQLKNWTVERNFLNNAICLAGAAIIITTLLWRTSSRRNIKKTAKKTTKKAANKTAKKETVDLKSAPLTKELHIDSILFRFEQEYKPGLLQLLQRFDPNDEKNVYKRRYYSEMLLKLLIELDGIDITTLKGERKVELKLRRKAVIKEIQQHLKLLDTLQ